MTKTQEQCYDIIDRLHLEKVNGKPREEIAKQIEKALVSLNLSYVLADVVDYLMMDCESTMRELSVEYEDPAKTYFKEMKKLAGATRKWAQRATRDINLHEDAEMYQGEVDWWYNMVRLLEDRTGDNVIKTKQVLQWLLTMPSEMNLFKIKMSDFKRSLYDIPDDDRQTETSG